MAIYSPRGSGIGNSAAYQVAGKPYATASVVDYETSKTFRNSKEYKVTFPTVTRSVTITNNCSGSNLAIHFVSKATSPSAITAGQYVLVPCTNIVGDTTGSFTMNIKCKELYISPGPQHATTAFGSAGVVGGPLQEADANNFSIFAELTGVPPEEMYELSGSGISAARNSDGHH